MFVKWNKICSNQDSATSVNLLFIIYKVMKYRKIFIKNSAYFKKASFHSRENIKSCVSPELCHKPYLLGIHVGIQKVLSEGATLTTFYYGFKYHQKQADDGPTLNAGLVALSFPGDPDQYC